MMENSDSMTSNSSDTVDKDPPKTTGKESSKSREQSTPARASSKSASSSNANGESKSSSKDKDESSSSGLPGAEKEEPSDLKKPAASCLCKCAFFKGQPCKFRYSEEELQNIRKQYANMEHKDLDLVILSKLQYGMHLSQNIVRSRKNRPIERKQQSTDYSYHGQSICREMFKYMHNISQNRLSALIKHYKAHGLRARVHGNCNRVQAHAFTTEDVTRVINFVTSYAEVHGKTSTVRSSKKPPVKRLILTNCTKKQVYDEYILSCGEQRKVSLSKFRSMWKKLIPSVRIVPPPSTASAPAAPAVTPETKQHNVVKMESLPAQFESIPNQFPSIHTQFHTSLNQLHQSNHNQLHAHQTNSNQLHQANAHHLQANPNQLQANPNHLQGIPNYETLQNQQYSMASFGRV